MTFRQWNERSCRLANALLGLGLAKGDRVAVLAYNCVEWLEIYAATAKAGLVAVPINFRLVGAEIRYIVENCRGRGAHRPGRAAGRRRGDPRRPADAAEQPASTSARRLPGRLPRLRGADRAPRATASRTSAGRRRRSVDADVHLGHHRQAQGRDPQPPRPARCCRWSPRSSSAFTGDDGALLVMPMCHANSLYFFGAFAYCGAATRGLHPQELRSRALLRDAGRRRRRPSPRWCRPTTS